MKTLKDPAPMAYMYWPMANRSEAECTAIRCTRYLRKHNPTLIAGAVKRLNGKWHVAIAKEDVLKYPDVADIATGS